MRTRAEMKTARRRLLQRGPGRVPRGRIATLRRWLDLLGEDAIARNAGLALMASWIAALGGDPVAAERWADAADAVRIDGPSLHGTASLRSSEAMVHAIMSRGGRTRCSARRRLPSGKRRGTSPFRAAAFGLLGLATMIRGDDEVADSLFAEASQVGLRIGGMPIASLALAERSLIATSAKTTRTTSPSARASSCTMRTSTSTSRPGRCTRPRPVRPCERAITTGLARSWPRPTDSARSSPGRSPRSRSRRDWSSRACTWACPTSPGARTLLAEVDEILAHRPDLGTLTTQAVELRSHVGSVRSDGRPGPRPAAELRLLTFLPTHLSFREIGARLFVSPNTVKTRRSRSTASSACLRARMPFRPLATSACSNRRRSRHSRFHPVGTMPRVPFGGRMSGRPRRTTADGQARGRAPMHGARRRAIRQGCARDAVEQRRRLGSGSEDPCARAPRGADRSTPPSRRSSGTPPPRSRRGATVDEIVGVLIAVAQTVGLARVSSPLQRSRALGYDIDAALEAHDEGGRPVGMEPGGGNDLETRPTRRRPRR